MNIAEEAWLYGFAFGIGIGMLLHAVIDAIIEGRTKR